VSDAAPCPNREMFHSRAKRTYPIDLALIEKTKRQINISR
jgi:hypothetical protein